MGKSWPIQTYANFKKTAELLRKAMEGIPERVPVFAQIHELAMAESRHKGRDFYRNAQNLVKGILETSKNKA